MNIYINEELAEKELQEARPYDEMQNISYSPQDKGYPFISTAEHGYLIVPLNHPHPPIRKTCYSYKTKHFVFLEEDCDARKFLNKIS